jgi:lipopolysaccharide transport system permease protein
MDQTTIITLKSGYQAINFRELWEYRELLFTLAGKDIRLRYKQTVLGVIWVVLQPLLAAGIFSFVFGKVAKLDSGGVPYFAFSYAGLMFWNLFTSIVSRANASLVSNSNLVTKIYFPRLILPLSGIPSALLDFSVAAILMIIIMFSYGIKPHIGLLMLPLWLAILLMLATGIGIWSGALAAKYRDINYILPVMIQLLLYASPIAYASTSVPTEFQTYYYMNPIAGPMDAIRWSILGTTQDSWWAVGYSAILGVIVLIVGAIMFRRMEREFADVI